MPGPQKLTTTYLVDKVSIVLNAASLIGKPPVKCHPDGLISDATVVALQTG